MYVVHLLDFQNQCFCCRADSVEETERPQHTGFEIGSVSLRGKLQEVKVESWRHFPLLSCIEWGHP